MSASELYVIVGLGATGLSCARYLTARRVPFAVMDTRENPPALPKLLEICPEATLALGELNASLLNRASHIVISPGIGLSEPAIAHQLKRGVPVIGDIELFAQVVNAPVIAITGTNAKSTVTTLVGKMAEAAGHHVQVGGNLGVPALDLLPHGPHTDLFVLELSSFQLETTHSLNLHVASLLNVTPDHMDRYTDFIDYQRAKYRIYQHCRAAICNRDDPLTDCKEAVQHKFYFTLGIPQNADEFGLISRQQTTYLALGDELLLPVNELPVSGKHYQANALSALAIGHAFGLPFAPMLKVLREFQGLPHRCQLIRELQGVKWYNDSKGTNVGATQAAIEGLGSEMKGKLVVILGGIGKHADFTSLVAIVSQYVRHAVLIGEAAQDIAKAIGGHVPISFAQNMEEAIQQAATVAKWDDAVLLSPACASFDMFHNYEHRGNVFTELVKKM